MTAGRPQETCYLFSRDSDSTTCSRVDETTTENLDVQ